MINNVTDMLFNMTNTTGTPGASNSVDHVFPYVFIGSIAFWGLAIGARKGYEAIRDGRCNPCGLFRADTTTPHDQRTYWTFEGKPNGDMAAAVLGSAV